MNAMTSLRQLIHQTRALALVVALCAMLVAPTFFASPAFAQGNTGRPITVGDVVTGTLDADNVVQVYTFAASAGDTISIDVSTDVDELAPVVMVTDEDGTVIAQDLDLDTATTATISDIELPGTGTYYITVMRGSGADGDASGTFTLSLSGFQQIGGQTVTLENGGIVFELQWNAAVNLDLEVRDPLGNTVYHDSPGSPTGGVLDADINANCDTAVATSPTETIAWPAGDVPAGSYETIIYFVDACETFGSQSFTLSAQVNGEEQQSLTGTLNPGQEYLARLVLDPNGDWQLVNGGVNAGLNVSVFQRQIADATPVALGSTVSGTITNNTPAQAYTFTANAGTNVNINLTAQSGSLDTYLALLGPNGAMLAENDDIETSTDSRISTTLQVDGTYTIIATRYGLTIGGTEGEYNLSVTGQQAAAEAPPADTGTAPAVDDTATAGLPDGSIEVALEWATQADIQLQVRDPNGDTVYDDQPVIPSGGILEEAGNIGCVEPTDNPLSYIYWPPNRLSPGTYEVEVWYQDTCGDTRPVTFGLSVNVNQQTIINTTQAASPDSRYMITFEVQPDGTATAGPGGFFDMTNPATLNYTAQMPNAREISYGQTVSGSITAQDRFVLYAFEGQAGDSVTIGMDATGGTLDPALYLISPDNIKIAENDDIVPGEDRDSLIEEITLPSSGTYYVIATHYGLDVGGTQGTFSLTLVQE